MHNSVLKNNNKKVQNAVYQLITLKINQSNELNQPFY
jgi:hypothetical protein